MLNTRFTTTRELRAIKQAIRIIDSGGRGWRSKGWRGPYSGTFKKAYIKDGIVVKKGPEWQLKHELRLWLRTGRKPRLRKFRRNLARCFGLYNGWIIQRYVKPNNSWCQDKKCGRIARALKIEDWYHNHYHDNRGNPIWFDTRAW